MPPDIEQLAKGILVHPARVEVRPVATTAERIEQRLYPVDRANKKSLLVHLLQDSAISRVLVFTRTKHGASRLAKQLVGARIEADAIHGDKSQGQRERALAGFKDGGLRVLVATDIAARGIDVDAVSHVINFDLPDTPESYVHRIGRTARAGASGIAISFCSPEEKESLRDIERTTRQSIPRVDEHPFPSSGIAAAPAPQQQGRGGRQGQSRGGGGGQQQSRRRGGGGGGQGRSSGGGQPRAAAPAAAPAPKPSKNYVPKFF